MDPITGKLVLDGVVQIAVATLNKSAISPDEVPTFLKSIGDSLVTCINEASAAMNDAGEPAAARAVSRPAASAPKKAAASRSPAVVEAAASQSVSSSAAPPPVVASAAGKKAAPKTAAPVAVQAAAPAAVVAEPVVAEEEPYKFANIPREPVVPIKQSVFDDRIVCLIDGESRKMLQRHLRSKYQMSEEEYRAHFSLPDNYPMTAPGYSKEKSIVARAQGLGTAKLYENAKSKQKATPAKVTKRQRNKTTAAASA